MRAVGFFWTWGLMVSAGANACPPLSGSYLCAGGTKGRTVEIRQINPTEFSIDGFLVTADSQIRALPNDGEFRSGTWQAWCSADELWLKIDGQFHPGQSEDPFGRVELTLQRSLDANGNLTLRNDGFLWQGEQRFRLRGKAVCPRQ